MQEKKTQYLVAFLFRFRYTIETLELKFLFAAGAKRTAYLVTADDVDCLLAIDVLPLDDRKRKVYLHIMCWPFLNGILFFLNFSWILYSIAWSVFVYLYIRLDGGYLFVVLL